MITKKKPLKEEDVLQDMIKELLEEQEKSKNETPLDEKIIRGGMYARWAEEDRYQNMRSREIEIGKRRKKQLEEEQTK